MNIEWTDYFKYRAALRGFELSKIENILRYSTERYFDVETRHSVIVGNHGQQLVLIPCEKNAGTIIPVTIHATTRQQIKFRINIGRFIP